MPDHRIVELTVQPLPEGALGNFGVFRAQEGGGAAKPETPGSFQATSTARSS